MKSTSKDLAFIKKGYTNWKDATESFRRHEKSNCHQETIQAVLIPSNVPDIGEMVSNLYAQNKVQNHKLFLKILQNIKFLARQGIAFRGHDEVESNFIQLLKLREIDNPELSSWMRRRTDKYVSPEMHENILLDLAKGIHSSDIFSILADECTDMSNKEQLAICFRWIDAELEIHEDFVGLYHIDNIAADTIVIALKDCLLRMSLPLKRCRGQCYDGAANMAGYKRGVATQILTEEPRALYTHCYGHSLNLAMCDTIKQCRLTRDTMDVTNEISKLIKFSPKRNGIFEKI